MWGTGLWATPGTEVRTEEKMMGRENPEAGTHIVRVQMEVGDLQA